LNFYKLSSNVVVNREKEACTELLKLLLNLLQALENEQAKILEDFKQSCSSSKKGGVFKKLFNKK